MELKLIGSLCRVCQDHLFRDRVKVSMKLRLILNIQIKYIQTVPGSLEKSMQLKDMNIYASILLHFV